MDYRDKLHKNKQFLTNPLRVALFAVGLVRLRPPLRQEAVLWQRQSRRLYMERQK